MIYLCQKNRWLCTNVIRCSAVKVLEYLWCVVHSATTQHASPEVVYYYSKYFYENEIISTAKHELINSTDIKVILIEMSKND